MTHSKHRTRIFAHILLAGSFAIWTATPFVGALANDRDGGWGHHHDFGPHPTLPVPGALVFGAIAVSGAAIAARRRRKGKSDIKSGTNKDTSPGT